LYFIVFSSRASGVERNVRQVLADGNQTDPTRHVTHTEELSQGVHQDAETVPERILITRRPMTHSVPVRDLHRFRHNIYI